MSQTPPERCREPVLVIGFNRPALMRAQIDALRVVAPRELYIAVDGPRPEVPDDRQAVAESRAVVNLVDWDCEVHTLFPAVNIGARAGPFGAIDWFLTSVERGIILEDDVVASPQFFAFASEMLDRYEDDHRVAGITGMSLDPPAQREELRSSYRFTSVPQVWGWATWSHSWTGVTLDISDRKQWLNLADVSRSLHWPLMLRAVIAKRIHDSAIGRVKTWDAQFMSRGLARGAMYVMPARALTTNVGVFNKPAHPGYEPLHMRPLEPLEWPLRHPDVVGVDPLFDVPMLTAAFEATPRGYAAKAARKIRRALDRGG